MKFTSGVLFVLAVSLCMSSVLAVTMKVHTGSQTLHIRTEPNTRSGIVADLGPNAQFEVDCQVNGETISGDSGTTNVWYHVAGRGYVSGAFVYGQAVQACGPAKVVIHGTTLNIRSQPNTHSSVVGSLNGGTEVSIDCQTTGDNISGEFRTTNIWYHVAGRGYISGGFVNNGGRTYPGCSVTPPSPSGDCSAGLRNPRSCSEAVAWAEAHLTNTYHSEYRGLCDHFVGLCYGRSASGFETALIHWNTTPERFRHYDRNPPPGALCFFRSSAAGHACISTGGGGIISTDINCPGCLGRTSIAGIESKWGAPYLGWTNPYFHNA